jgi:hypothetical protein
MRLVPVAAAVAAALLLSSAPSSAQSLAELAAREKERRAKAKAGKTYTESDLGRGSSAAVPVSDTTPEATVPTSGAEATKTEPAKKEKTEDELRAEREAAWRERVGKANAEITRLQDRADALQRALNDLTQNLYGSTRQAQANELEQVQTQLTAARKGLEDLQEEGRRNGYR